MLELLPMTAGPDTRAFFEEFYPHVYRMVWAKTGGPHDLVEEVAQDVLLHAWRDRGSFRAESDPSAWIGSIARHRLSERRRKEGRREKADAVLRAAARIDTEPLPEQILGAGEFRARVWSALEKIGKDYSELLVRRYVEDRSVREMSEERGESEKAVESRLHRAREAFREALRSGEDHEP
jgi:RNA polymerase sigma-70 factor (ECF subfamily)